ncbi:hypothetical protein D1Y84_16375 [Acidipila sp. EB88]|nr:hypothetical protein D1Y84_16375 [Acidipila sp. EB88]
MQARDKPETTTHFADDFVILRRYQCDLLHTGRLEQRTTMWWSTSHGKIAERSPDLVPTYAPIGSISQRGGAHGARRHVFVSLLVYRRQKELDPRLQYVQNSSARLRGGGHRIIIRQSLRREHNLVTTRKRQT